MDDSERDKLLIRLDTRMETVADSLASLKKGMYGEDGQSGLCGRVTTLENQQSRWLGRDGAIVAGISAGIAILTVAIGLKGGT
jgi:hypothetical protein